MLSIALAKARALRHLWWMKKTIFLYALGVGLAASVLQWLEYRYITHAFSPQVYGALIAIGFTILGAWLGHRLTGKPRDTGFEINARALQSLGISTREYEVLSLLAAGHANKEIARRLGVSPNTIKTHIARLYEKLDVKRRTQAVHKAKALALIA